MINKKDLQEAIAECTGKRNPTADTCMKLAAYYTIQDHLYKDTTPTKSMSAYRPVVSQSFAADPLPESRSYDGQGGSEFLDLVKGKDVNVVMAVMDELMTTLGVINPRLYEGVMTKLLY